MKKIKKPLLGQENFYFQDYDYLKDINKVKIKDLNISYDRISFIFFIFLIVSVIYFLKVVYLASINNENYFANVTYLNSNKINSRQDILDRNGNILAKSTPFYEAAIKSDLILDKEKLLINLKIIFPLMDISEIRKKMNNKNFFYIKKRLRNDERQKLWLLGDKSIIISQKLGRVYPHKSLFSHVVGQIDNENLGISGIEKKFDNYLKNSNNSLSLSLDSNLQYLIKEELLNAHKIFNPIGSAALLMDIKNGEILSLISLPDFDLNVRNKLDDDIYLNKITKGVYEFGSVFKTFTIAAGLETKIIKKNSYFENLPNKIICGGRRIGEYNNKIPRDLNVEQILVRSSNVGSIKIARMIGEEKLKNFYKDIEIFNKIEFDLEEVGKPLPIDWGKCTLETASYGHGVTTTPLQLAKAYAILTNGGYKIKPTLIKSTSKKQEKKQLVSEHTSSQIKNMLRKVVSTKEGTAKFADISGYDIAGKTGTADKYNSDELRNTFISFFPYKDPNYALLVLLDEPKSAPNYIYTFRHLNNYKSSGYKKNTAGWNAALIAGKIIEKIGPILAINNLHASVNF